jgi:5,10-methylenetetrahydromethanopterin reductase
MQEVSGGRFLLGLGAGSEQFLGWAGIPRPRPLGTTAAALVTLRALLGHRDVDAALLPDWYGPESVLRFALATPVPVYVGGMGPKMLRMAGEHADGVLPLLYPPEHYAVARGHVLAGRAGQRRPFDFPACFWVSIGPDGAAARAALAQKLAYYGPSISPHLLATVGLRPDDFAPAAELAQRGADAAALVDDRMLSLGIAGSVDDVIERCVRLQGLGADHLSFGPPLGPDVVGAVRLLGAEVLPALSTRARKEPA